MTVLLYDRVWCCRNVFLLIHCVFITFNNGLLLFVIFAFIQIIDNGDCHGRLVWLSWINLCPRLQYFHLFIFLCSALSLTLFRFFLFCILQGWIIILLIFLLWRKDPTLNIWNCSIVWTFVAVFSAVPALSTKLPRRAQSYLLLMIIWFVVLINLLSKVLEVFFTHCLYFLFQPLHIGAIFFFYSVLSGYAWIILICGPQLWFHSLLQYRIQIIWFHTNV
jgi:hypothetical protein